MFPEAKSYLDVYDRFGLVTQRSLFAHGIYGQSHEFELFKASGASVVSCPTSNTFLGSGLFDPRNYGYKKLGELASATKLFQNEERAVGDGLSKAIYLKDKRKK